MTLADKKLTQATQFHQQGHLGEAEKLYRLVLKKDPRHPAANLNCGMLYQQLGRNDLAIPLLKNATLLAPDLAAGFHYLGNSYRLNEQHPEGIAALKQALVLAEDNPQTHNTLAMMLRDSSDLASASTHFQRAIELNEHYAEAHHNYASLLRELGEPQQALRHSNQALKLKPEALEVLRNHGGVLFDLGDLERALRVFRKAADIKADDAEILASIGLVLLRQDDVANAQQHFDSALAIDPLLAAAHCGNGTASVNLGALKQAEHNFRRALELDPLLGGAHSQLSQLRRHVERDQDVVAMEQALAEIPEGTENSMQVLFGLGAAEQNLGNYEPAFDYYSRANRIKNKMYEFDHSAFANQVAALKHTFSAEFIAEHHAQGDPNAQPIFIVGMPRSGTSLTEQILSGHSSIHGGGERTYLSKLVNGLDQLDQNQDFPALMARLKPADFAVLGQGYLQRALEIGSTKTHFTDKLPHNFLHIGLIRTILPNARIIHCQRHPADTCLSLYQQLFRSDHPYAYDLANLGHYYASYIDMMAHWRRVAPAAIYELNHEALVNSPEQEICNLLEFLELPYEADCLDFQNNKRTVITASASQVRQPLSKRSIGRWQHYRHQLKPLLDTFDQADIKY